MAIDDGGSGRAGAAAEDPSAEQRPAPRKRGPKVDVELTRQRRADIVREAAALFDRVGYHGVNMEMIAEAAGLKKPTLYHYISGKEEILFKMQEAMIVPLRERLHERVSAGAGRLTMLRGIYEDIFHNLHDMPGMVRAFFEHQRDVGSEREAQNPQAAK